MSSVSADSLQTLVKIKKGRLLKGWERDAWRGCHENLCMLEALLLSGTSAIVYNGVSRTVVQSDGEKLINYVLHHTQTMLDMKEDILSAVRVCISVIRRKPFEEYFCLSYYDIYNTRYVYHCTDVYVRKIPFLGPGTTVFEQRLSVSENWSVPTIDFENIKKGLDTPPVCIPSPCLVRMPTSETSIRECIDSAFRGKIPVYAFEFDRTMTDEEKNTMHTYMYGDVRVIEARLEDKNMYLLLSHCPDDEPDKITRLGVCRGVDTDVMPCFGQTLSLFGMTAFMIRANDMKRAYQMSFLLWFALRRTPASVSEAAMFREFFDIWDESDANDVETDTTSRKVIHQMGRDAYEQMMTDSGDDVVREVLQFFGCISLRPLRPISGTLTYKGAHFVSDTISMRRVHETKRTGPTRAEEQEERENDMRAMHDKLSSMTADVLLLQDERDKLVSETRLLQQKIDKTTKKADKYMADIHALRKWKTEHMRKNEENVSQQEENRKLAGLNASLVDRIDQMRIAYEDRFDELTQRHARLS